MSKLFCFKAGLTSACIAATLAGCSSFVQQPAPVESPAQTPTYRASAQPAVEKPPEQPVAQTAPYRAEVSLQAPRAQPAAATHAVSADDGKTHVVQAGENLFRIALSHGLKYQVLASWNQLPDFNIKVGQVLRLTPPGSVTSHAPASAPVAASAVVKPYPKGLKLPYTDSATREISAQSEGSGKTAHPLEKHDSSVPAASKAASDAAPGKAEPPAKAGADDKIVWSWPSNGRTLRGYSDSNKGVDIGGRPGQPVLASADGKVVYSGTGLRGYGKLIIIKHNKTFLSAYAHNSQLLVKEGQAVKKGQKIAEMGNTDADQVKLHFEIRRFGKPVDPMQYLNSKP
jgi:lipoprotein NlpD